MKAHKVGELAKGLLIDVDGMIAGDPRDPAGRHSAAASALILATRLIGSIAINIARIADASSRIANALEDAAEQKEEEEPCSTSSS